jgi:hypothetical protein
MEMKNSMKGPTELTPDRMAFVVDSEIGKRMHTMLQDFPGVGVIVERDCSMLVIGSRESMAQFMTFFELCVER